MILAKLKAAGVWIMGLIISAFGILTFIYKAKLARAEKEMEIRNRKAADAKNEVLQRAQQAHHKASQRAQASIKEAIDEANDPDHPRDHFNNQL